MLSKILSWEFICLHWFVHLTFFTHKTNEVVCSEMRKWKKIQKCDAALYQTHTHTHTRTHTHTHARGNQKCPQDIKTLWSWSLHLLHKYRLYQLNVWKPQESMLTMTIHVCLLCVSSLHCCKLWGCLSLALTCAFGDPIRRGQQFTPGIRMILVVGTLSRSLRKHTCASLEHILHWGMSNYKSHITNSRTHLDMLHHACL